VVGGNRRVSPENSDRAEENMGNTTMIKCPKCEDRVVRMEVMQC